MWDDEESGSPSWDAWSYFEPTDFDYGVFTSPEFNDAFDIANPEFFPMSESNPLGYDPNESYNLPSTWLDDVKRFASSVGGQAWNAAKKMFTKPDGSLDFRALATAGGALIPLLTGSSGSSSRPSGYQGGIPQYTAVREQVPGAYDPNRRPGSGGQRYFTDVQYVPRTGEGAAEALTAAQTAAAEQAQGLASLNTANPLNAAPPAYQPPAQQVQPAPAAPAYNESYSGANVLNTVREMLNAPRMARGGIVGLQDGGFVVPADVVSHLGNGSTDAGLAHLTRKGAVPIRGKGDGMSDSNRTTINGRQPAAVADGEAYLPPRQVQNMGGAEKLYAMMDKIRKDRTGSPKQGKQINPNQYV